MNILKNPFAKSTTPPGPLATTADDAAKGKQLLRGRTKAKVETLTAELDAAACADLKQAETDAKRESLRALLIRLNATANTVSVKQSEMASWPLRRSA